MKHTRPSPLQPTRIVLLFVVLLLAPVLAQRLPSAAAAPTTYYVAPSGNDSADGSKAKPWKTISYAVSADSPVAAGDTVLVQPGTYTEIVTIAKSGSSTAGPITLKADGAVTVRDPEPDKGRFIEGNPEGVIQSIEQEYLVIDGFRVEKSSYAGISIRDAKNITVQNNTTFETGASGIIALPASYYGGGEEEVTCANIKVLNNTIKRANVGWKGRGTPGGIGDQEALSIWGCDGFEVAFNTLNEGNREGIDAKVGSRNGSIHNNVVTKMALVTGTPGGYNGGPAIYLDGSRAEMFNIDVYNNLVYDNVADGIAVADEEIPGDVHDIRIYNNVVYNNGRQGVNAGFGVSIGSNVRNILVEHNTFASNVQGFSVDGSDFARERTNGTIPKNIVLRNNIFADAKYRNGVVSDAEDVQLTNNLFTDTIAELYADEGNVKNFAERDNATVASVDFVDAAEADYRLAEGSPAIDAAASSSAAYLRTDADGNTRPAAAGPDIGAYEFGATQPPAAETPTTTIPTTPFTGTVGIYLPLLQAGTGTTPPSTTPSVEPTGVMSPTLTMMPDPSETMMPDPSTMPTMGPGTMPTMEPSTMP